MSAKRLLVSCIKEDLMLQNIYLRRTIALGAMLATTVPAAFSAPPSHKGNVLQRHPTATGVVAGAATHHALKVSAKNKKAHHQKLNFAEKHPTITGIGTAIGAHHLAKHSKKK
jgi:hypothetical protein